MARTFIFLAGDEERGRTPPPAPLKSWRVLRGSNGLATADLDPARKAVPTAIFERASILDLSAQLRGERELSRLPRLLSYRFWKRMRWKWTFTIGHGSARCGHWLTLPKGYGWSNALKLCLSSIDNIVPLITKIKPYAGTSKQISVVYHAHEKTTNLQVLWSQCVWGGVSTRLHRG